jgi:hypothetical protein
MKLSIRALAIVSSVLWGGAVLVVGLVNLVFPSYGVAFLQAVSSVYPGFHAAGTFGDVLVGTMYALVDGALCGFFFGWLYNRFVLGWKRPGVR